MNRQNLSERDRAYLPSGYTGHVPGSQATIAERYGVITEKHLQRHPLRSKPQQQSPASTMLAVTGQKLNFLPPEPQFTPGYTGHVPGYKTNTGERFGYTSHSYLAAHVPANTSSISSSEYGAKRNSEADAPPSHSIPGYAGFVPCMQNRFGKTEAVAHSQGRAELDAKTHARQAQFDQYVAAHPPTHLEQPPRPSPPQSALAGFADRKYSQRVGVMAGYSGHIPQQRYLDTGHTFAEAARQIGRELESGAPIRTWDSQIQMATLPRATTASGAIDRSSRKETQRPTPPRPATANVSKYATVLSPHQQWIV